MLKKILKRASATFLAVLIAFGTVITSQHTKIFADEVITEESIKSSEDKTSYLVYSENHSDKAVGKDEIVIFAKDYISSDNAELTVEALEGADSALLWKNSEGSATWNFTVEDSGLYEISVEYYQLTGRRSAIEIGLMIDGEYPFKESKSSDFSRIWHDSSKIVADENGDEYAPDVVETPKWTVASFKDCDGYYDNSAYNYYLSAGQHTLTFTSNNEPFALKKIFIKGKEEIPTYKEYLEQNKNAKKYSGEEIRIQAESPYEKSDSALRAQSDKDSPITEPSSPTKIRYNCIGGNSWKYQSQWISWKVTVKEDGYYKLAMRYRQELIKGFPSYRKLYVDGAVPFKEANSLRFAYTEDWKMYVLGGEEPQLIYLTKGTHEIKLEVVAGEISNSVNELQDTAEELIKLYRKIIAITGTAPDEYRDYHICDSVKEIPDVLTKAAKNLKAAKTQLEKIVGEKTFNAGVIETLLSQINDILDDPDTIVDGERLGTFSSNVSGLSSWLYDMKYQPLMIDYFSFMSADDSLPRVEANFFEKFIFSAKRFLSSFAGGYSYSSISKDEGANEAITVWISLGRDQAQIMKNMISDSFTADTGINVNIKLVSATLVQAVLANDGPDVSIMTGRDQPVNLAIRNALVDLSLLDGFDKVKENFNETAFDPYEFNDGCYGIPDSQYFSMMFYRTDILDEMNLKAPDTWDELLKLSPILQRNNMRIGLPSAGLNIYSALLIQNGESFYNKKLTDTNWGTEKAYDAFLAWTDFYNQHGFSLEYNFINLFRTGEMPIGIADYSMYNTIKVTAPEIDGTWKMVPIPGTIKSDGTIDRSVCTAGTAAILFKNSDNPEAAWKFLKWWTGEEAQTRYALDMESVMGVAARQYPANNKALDNISWSKTELDAIKSQKEYVVDLPELPGGYYVTRNLSNAFNDAVVNGKNARESLSKWTKETTIEIKRKFKEFGIDDKD